MNQTRLRALPALASLIAGVVALASGPALGDRPERLSECTTIDKPGSYVLTRNLSAAGDCLVVAADFVTIDLGGWVIAGDGSTGAGVTDQGAPRRGIAVHNGTVTGFETGVRLGATSRAVVEEVRAIDHESSGISAGPFSIVRGNNASGAIGIGAGQFSTISGNTAGGDDLGAIIAGPGSTISGNTVEGIRGIRAGPGSTVSNNTALASQEDGGDNGIRVDCPSNVIGNTATGFSNNLVLSGEGCTNIDNLVP